jgi:hypothetical protein
MLKLKMNKLTFLVAQFDPGNNFFYVFIFITDAPVNKLECFL